MSHWEDDEMGDEGFGLDDDDCTSDMAMGQVHRLHDLASDLEDMIDDTDNLPDWVKYKITSAMGDLEDVYNFMEPQFHDDDEFEDDDEECYDDGLAVGIGLGALGEGRKKKRKRRRRKKRGLWDNIRDKRARGEPPAGPGEPGRPSEKTWRELTKSGYEPVGEDLLREMIQLVVEKKKCKGYKKSPVGSPRQRSFCRRMCGMRKKNTGAKTAGDPDSCINQSLRRWRCRCS